MEYYATYPAIRLHSQAIPMAVYRRQLFLAQWRPRMVLLLFVFGIYWVTANPLVGVAPRPDIPIVSDPRDVLADPIAIVSRPSVAELRPELVVVQKEGVVDAELGPLKASAAPQVAGMGSAVLRGSGSVSISNVGIAISFIDGVVIEPGGRFSFDDTARTWDFHEDPRYLWGTATSARGVISMRGGGVCWLSTAIWRAALGAGLQTEFRENHYGLVPILGSGLDATNTLVLRNDTDVPITIRVWKDSDRVYAALSSDGPLDRTSTVRGPVRGGNGTWVAYQDITFDDGRTKTNEFVSRYFW